MERRQLILMMTIAALFALMNIFYTGQLLRAKQEALDARKMARDSEQYQVQLMNITMYAPLSAGAIGGHDFSGDPSITYSGEKVVPGKTAAAGPNIPLGTEIYVEGLGWRRVNDRGGAIGPNDIDLAVATKEEAIAFGRQQRLVILKLPRNDK
ncbi:MAG TPA: 3D domain-containing protein [Bacillota bacterium]|jgi:3D (Asp-Asp-Asp) domain-containing protein|nr:3D domain-containing protein [Bacillota bacterium]HOL14934.1 3D domain-containing protein [Bacillota bacterium]